ncbi:hypothetical protein TELCIR_24567 [Teladorsagia circumcincta]|uniref:Uncharacterized protein n=1 Tax=Teladorsagia circumcincta TaxID=45464 RepID=A0A2G9T860_TELCI|nr:hypothetical protein TELCIR_24567 [Teladorsagia circumcincta]
MHVCRRRNKNTSGSTSNWLQVLLERRRKHCTQIAFEPCPCDNLQPNLRYCHQVRVPLCLVGSFELESCGFIEINSASIYFLRSAFCSEFMWMMKRLITTAIYARVALLTSQNARTIRSATYLQC